ncbi:MAG: recombination mediator RecR [Oleiphilaceae bacterium]|nr:recombination mediator RecR [Oleiphilaceae bacterium]
MSLSPLLDELVDALRCLPGVGQKSAQRMAFHLLERGREGAGTLADTLDRALRDIGRCESCQTFTESPVCAICNDGRRDSSLLCVVESPADLVAIEQSGDYRGHYFVLLGHLSPIDGIGPGDIGIPRLLQRAAENEVQELILATNPTVEGEATAHYIADRLGERGVRITRLANGLPVGGDLGGADGSTLSHAFRGRRPLSG